FYSSDLTGANTFLANPDASEPIGGFQKENFFHITNKWVLDRTSEPEVAAETYTIQAVGPGKWVGLDASNEIQKLSPDSHRSIPSASGVQWRLAVQHKAGSLDAAVDSNRQRNLGISFGILLLLGASILTMWIASRRVQRIAGQQIAFVAGVSHELRT